MGVRPPEVALGQRLRLRSLPGIPNDVSFGGIDRGANQLLLFERGHWCVACRKHLTQVASAIDEFTRRNIDVQAVVHEPLGDIQAAMMRSDYPFPIGADEDLAASEALGIVGVDEYSKRTIRPTALILRPGGEIAFSYVGDDSIDRLSVPALLLAIDRMA